MEEPRSTTTGPAYVHNKETNTEKQLREEKDLKQ
jgi:hypothetical protein